MQGLEKHQLWLCHLPQCWLSKLDVPMLLSLIKAETVVMFHMLESKTQNQNSHWMLDFPQMSG